MFNQAMVNYTIGIRILTVVPFPMANDIELAAHCFQSFPDAENYQRIFFFVRNCRWYSYSVIFHQQLDFL